MSLQVTWKIENMERSPDDGFVDTIHWRVYGFEPDADAGLLSLAGIRVSNFGSINNLTRGEEFTPFEELTEEQVIQWVKDYYGEEQIALFVSDLQNQIDFIKTPPKVGGLPWGNQQI